MGCCINNDARHLETVNLGLKTLQKTLSKGQFMEQISL